MQLQNPIMPYYGDWFIDLVEGNFFRLPKSEDGEVSRIHFVNDKDKAIKLATEILNDADNLQMTNSYEKVPFVKEMIMAVWTDMDELQAATHAMEAVAIFPSLIRQEKEKLAQLPQLNGWAINLDERYLENVESGDVLLLDEKDDHEQLVQVIHSLPNDSAGMHKIGLTDVIKIITKLAGIILDIPPHEVAEMFMSALSDTHDFTVDELRYVRVTYRVHGGTREEARLLMESGEADEAGPPDVLNTFPQNSVVFSDHWAIVGSLINGNDLEPVNHLISFHDCPNLAKAIMDGIMANMGDEFKLYVGFNVMKLPTKYYDIMTLPYTYWAYNGALQFIRAIQSCLGEPMINRIDVANCYEHHQDPLTKALYREDMQVSCNSDHLWLNCNNLSDEAIDRLEEHEFLYAFRDDNWLYIPHWESSASFMRAFQDGTLSEWVKFDPKYLKELNDDVS